MDFQGRICNLCLIKCENFKAIEGNMKINLNMFLPTIKFTGIHEPVICENCEDTLRKCRDFKATCLHLYDSLIPLLYSKDAVKLDLRDVYLSKNITTTSVSEDQNICGFCMSLVENYYAISLDVDVKEGDFLLEKMIPQCLPELDLSIIKNPIICADCHRSLENCFRFVTNCLAVEEKIKKYCESLDENSRDKIELSSLLHCSMKSVQASDEDDDAVDVIKAEKQSYEKVENLEERRIDSAGDVIKSERMFCDDNEQQFTSKNMDTCAEEDNMLGTIKIEETFCGENETESTDCEFVEMDDQKFILNEEIEIKTDDHDFNRSEKSVQTQTRINGRLSRKRKCLISHRENQLIKPHLTLMKKDARKITNQHECGLLQTKNTQCIKTPEVFYKASSEVALFKCDSCSYQTNHKYSLNNHLLKHMDPSEIPVFCCDLCSFRTKYKKCLRQHVVTHKASSEITTFKCDSCPFQTRLKRSLKSHMLKHMDPSKVTLFTCDFCPHQTKYKHALKQHLLSHKTSSEVTMFKCDSCPFQTKRKRTLNNHMLKHMDPSEVTMFNCNFCSYQTKYKERLKQHFITHKASSEVTMFQCDFCPFLTSRKQNIKDHTLRHMHPSEVTMFNCDFCSYQTKFKKCLKQHSITHKTSSEVIMFKCDSCPYQTKYKKYLQLHLVTHKASSEVTMFKCDSCPFQSRWKSAHKTHMLKHIKSNNV